MKRTVEEIKGYRYILMFALIGLFSCSNDKSGQEGQSNEAGAEAKPNQVYSVWMADSEIRRNPEGWMIDFRETPKWEYTNGLFASALAKTWEQTGDKKYFDYINEFGDFMIGPDGSIKTYKKQDYNIDRVNSGKFLIELYKETNIDKYRLAIEDLRDQMRLQPRTKEGGFWHKKIYPHQMWLDGLYMGAPFLAQYAREFNEPELFDDVANQFFLINKYTWDGKKEVYYHGWDESREQKWADKETGLSPHVWGRAMGWLSMAAVDVLDYIPEEHPDRDKVMQVLKNVALSIKKYQDEDSGVWWQIIDQPGRDGNYLESSASSMFVYSLAKAVYRGYLPEEYMEVALDGYQGIIKNFIREDPDGGISITNACAVAGLGGDPYRDGSYEYYVGEPQRDNDPKAVGPFIMASLLIEKREQLAVNQ